MPLFSREPTGLHALLHRPRPTAWSQFLASPCLFLARMLYTWRGPLPFTPPPDAVTIVCVSDTHNSQPALPPGDVLIHAGDLTQSGTLRELQAALDWLRAQPHPVKIVVAGNHDRLLDRGHDGVGWVGAAQAEVDRARLDWGGVVYLENESKEVTCANGRRLRVYGSPMTPRHGNWAFQYPRAEGGDVWAGRVPPATEVLVTHGPPRAHLDLMRTGCEGLLREVWRVRPRLHVCGHVHEGAGREWLGFDGLQEAYERTVREGGGWGNLVRVVVAVLRVVVRPRAEARGLIVNAAVVGGLRDDERRKPVTVVI
ncbi:Metallo-dependent phosphatase-like protein [Staphylotrichum tortipilum]|uniref:Metallo-dependent phosphatase-like protein n=1 Tax=Staphylotrichum tortipilum TaxID=2831512 RepID=A0AAN6RS82_9PEZI|nr:Metallo-dependent phosphatase-like protein [Staphylotrichum longicolle]